MAAEPLLNLDRRPNTKARKAWATTHGCARFNNGSPWYVWVDYNGTTLEVRISQVNARPASPTLSSNVNLASVLGTTNAFVGFTAGTGAGFETHDILQWQLNNTFAPIGGVAAPPTDVPTLSQYGLLLLLVGIALLGVRALRRA